MHLILKKQYFEEIEWGLKTTEFRCASHHWSKRLSKATHLVFSLGLSLGTVRLPGLCLIARVVLSH